MLVGTSGDDLDMSWTSGPWATCSPAQCILRSLPCAILVAVPCQVAWPDPWYAPIAQHQDSSQG